MTIEIDGVPVNEQTGEIANLPAIRAVGAALHEEPQQLTHAQARVNAVSSVMDAAMSRASTLKITPEQGAALMEDFPDDAFKKGAAGKDSHIYIEHAFLRDRFIQVFGMGRWAIIRTRPHWAEEIDNGKSTRVYADCSLLIDGCMVADAIGDGTYYANNASQTYSDAAEAAETQAFRRCAKKFGVGLQAWKKDWCEAWWKRNPKGRVESSSTGKAPPPQTDAQVSPRETVDNLLSEIGGWSRDQADAMFNLKSIAAEYRDEVKAAITARREWFAALDESRAKADAAAGFTPSAVVTPDPPIGGDEDDLMTGFPAEEPPITDRSQLSEFAHGCLRNILRTTTRKDSDSAWENARKSRRLLPPEQAFIAKATSDHNAQWPLPGRSRK
jgi:hypothetical protein